MEKERVALVVLAVILLIAIIVLVLMKTKECSNLECFNSALEKCKKAAWLSDENDAAWEYTIKGKANEECEVNVKLVEIKQGKTDVLKLQGMEMKCYVPAGFSGNPQADLSKCHGALKEEMQDVIINKMHSYILDNIGKISSDLTKAV